MLPNGDLLISNVDVQDGFKSFACRITNKLTNEAKTSRVVRISVEGKNFKKCIFCNHNVFLSKLMSDTSNSQSITSCENIERLS